MSKGPGLFSEIGKIARDVLTKDYITDQQLSVSTYSDAGVALTSSAVTKGGLSAGDVSALYKYNNTLINVNIDTGSVISTTLTFPDIVPSTMVIASFMLPKLNYAKLEVQYFHETATFTTAAALDQSPTIDLTATVGTPTFAFGGEAGYDTTSGTFSKYNFGINVTRPNANVSIIVGDKADTITASYVHSLNLLKTSTVVGEISRRFSTNENTFTVGGAYAIDPLTVVKAKLNNHGKLGALMQHEVIPKSVLTISGEIDTKALDVNPRFGLALALKP